MVPPLLMFAFLPFDGKGTIYRVRRHKGPLPSKRLGFGRVFCIFRRLQTTLQHKNNIFLMPLKGSIYWYPKYNMSRELEYKSVHARERGRMFSGESAKAFFVMRSRRSGYKNKCFLFSGAKINVFFFCSAGSAPRKWVFAISARVLALCNLT